MISMSWGERLKSLLNLDFGGVSGEERFRSGDRSGSRVCIVIVLQFRRVSRVLSQFRILVVLVYC